MAGIVRVAVTGAAGQVAYTLLPRLASGEVFGPDTQVILQLLEIPRSITPKPMDMLEGVAMELEDCGFPTLKEIIVTDDENKAFDGCNWALLVGAAPRGPGMERKDLLLKNAQIFQKQGRALAANAAVDHVKSLLRPTPANDWVSMAVVSKGQYGVPAGLVFGYPCRCDGNGNYSVVEGVKLDAFGQEKFKITLKELEEEREAVKE